MRFFPFAVALRVAFATTLLSCMTLPAYAQTLETWTLGARTFHDVRVIEVTPATVMIRHRGGISQLELKDLPSDLQARFNFDAQAGAVWDDRTRAELAASNHARREAERLRIESLREAKAKPPAPPAQRQTALGNAGAAAPTEVILKAEVDLRPVFEHHGIFYKNQGRRPSCAIFAAVSAIELELARSVGLPEPLSEEFVIWAARKLRPGLPINDGLHFREVMAAVQAHGVPVRSLMPNTFGIPLNDISPSPEAVFDASQRRDLVPIWYRVNEPEILARIVYSLNHDTPVVIGIRWPHWRTLQNNHLLRDQKPLAGAGHAVTLIGYRCEDGNPDNLVFLFRNSYGIDWGLGGCGFVAASYLKNNLLDAFHIAPREQVAATP